MAIKKWLVILWLVMLLVFPACKKAEPAKMDDGSEAISDTLKEDKSSPEKTDEISDEGDESSIETSDEGDESSVETGEEGESTPEEIVNEPLLDSEAMLERLGNYLLRPEDMPHAYYIPDGGELHFSTSRLINDMGELEAKTYVKNTGRIDGWWLQLKRTNKADFAPATFESSIELFETADGAQIAITPDYYQLNQDESREYTPVDGGCDFGDSCEFYYSEREDPTTELIIAQYNVAFIYKNAFVWVMSRGLTVDLDADYVLEAASLVSDKLEGAPTK